MPPSGWPRSSGVASAAAIWRWSTSSSGKAALQQTAFDTNAGGLCLTGGRCGLGGIDTRLRPDRAEHYPDQAGDREEQADGVEGAAEGAGEEGLGESVGEEAG